MSQDWIEEAKQEVERYFEEASDEQIQEDLEKAGYKFYKDVENPNKFNPNGFKN